MGGIVAGVYETGYINSLGHGGDGVETSVIVGKHTDVVSLSAEVGYRRRGNAEINRNAVSAAGSDRIDVRDDVFAHLGAYGGTTRCEGRAPNPRLSTTRIRR